MKKIQVVLENGTYTCDTGLSVSDWKNILQDLTLVNVERLDMLTKFYNEPGHKSTCKAIAEKYDKETVSAPQKYNSLNTQLGKSICKKKSYKKATHSRRVKTKSINHIIWYWVYCRFCK